MILAGEIARALAEVGVTSREAENLPTSCWRLATEIAHIRIHGEPATRYHAPSPATRELVVNQLRLVQAVRS